MMEGCPGELQMLKSASNYTSLKRMACPGVDHFVQQLQHQQALKRCVVYLLPTHLQRNGVSGPGNES